MLYVPLSYEPVARNPVFRVYGSTQIYPLSYIDYLKPGYLAVASLAKMFFRKRTKNVQPDQRLCCSHTQTGFLLNGLKELFQLSSDVLDLVKRLERMGKFAFLCFSHILW